ncbi:MAG: hypothetical protein R6V12_14905 [Candidatus Hydrogenedentota bacterium]
MRNACIAVAVACCLSMVVHAANVSVSAEPYLEGGLFTNPVLPTQGDTVTISVRAGCEGETPAKIPARLTIKKTGAEILVSEDLELVRQGSYAEANFTWSSKANGLFTVQVEVDPNNRLSESNRGDNTAEIILPFIIRGRNFKLHFPWYREVPYARWTTVVTSTAKGQENFVRLEERGVIPLNWAYGGMSWSYYDKEKARTNPEAVLKEIRQTFIDKYTGGGDEIRGFGIDEVGGYPETFKLDASIASMEALALAKREKPRRFFAVWNGGGPRPELAGIVRQGADLFLLETYLWRALPDELGTEDIYAAIEARVSPYIRNTDMFQPAYGNDCYTLIALDTSERPDRTTLGEQEEVIRFIRQRFPEMRGIGWYNGGYGSQHYGLVRTEEMDRHHEAVQRNADRLCFEYWIKPCLTFLPHSIWIEPDSSGGFLVTAALSNIGAVDSGPVAVELLCDGEVVAATSVNTVPAGANRNKDRAFFSELINLAKGLHTLEARITSAPGSTVLEGSVALERFVQK